MSYPPWKRWYKTGRWQALRITIFQRDLFTCHDTIKQREELASLHKRGVWH